MRQPSETGPAVAQDCSRASRPAWPSAAAGWCSPPLARPARAADSDPARRRQRRAGRRPRAGSSTVVEVDGLLDPVLVDFVEDADRRGRARRRGARSSSSSTAPGAVVSDDAPRRAGRHDRRRRRPGRRVGRARRARRAAERGRPAASRPPTSPAWRPGRSVEVDARLLDARGVGGRPRRRRRRRPGRRRAGARPRPRRQRRPGHRRASWSACPASRPEVAPTAARRAGHRSVAVRQLALVDQLHAHRGQPAGRLPAVRHRAWRCCSSSCSPPASASPAWSAPAAFVLGCYGLAVLPDPAGGRRRCWSSPCSAFAVDVQTGVPRVWTGIGTVLVRARVADPLRRRVAVVDHAAGRASSGIMLAMLAGMPAMVRTRFSTPTIGREWMVGEEGEAGTDVAPDGVVRGPGRAVAGPHQPGHADRRRATRCGWSPSTGSCSRSSPRRAAPATTASAIGPPTDPPRARHGARGRSSLCGAMTVSLTYREANHDHQRPPDLRTFPTGRVQDPPDHPLWPAQTEL